ncbi:hypothetical protein ACN47E_006004 [Coniothyrium glycines]
MRTARPLLPGGPLALAIITAMPWSLATAVAVAAMPSGPTRMLRHDNLVYVFQPAVPASSQPSTQIQLSSIDISSEVGAASLPSTTLFSSLPFLDRHAHQAFSPVLDHAGNLMVYAGNCSQGAAGGHLWTYSAASTGKRSTRTWQEEDVSVQSSLHASTMGPNYLNGGVAFSSTVGEDATTTGAFFFGGMCPYDNATSSNWQSAADYSNLMVSLKPSQKTSQSTSYNLDMSPSRGPPVPEAGFTMTGLSPTFSNRSDGSQTQQQNFVLVGGHTSAAFINMSQIALFSLPEQGWTFISVQQPDTTRTDVATRPDISSIDPRSGHTAVLSSDGRQIVVFGGWVGDVTTPAAPQYAILNVADGYGGDGPWRWTAPSTNGSGLQEDAGLYGHGAVMLPGNVLMISGGYSLRTSGRRSKRANSIANSKTYFLNVTSNTWMTSYSPPLGNTTSKPGSTGLLSSPAQKAGLGVGLGLGMAAVCGLFAFYMWYTRRTKQQRAYREKQLHDLSFATHRYNIDDFSPGFDGRAGGPDASDFITGQNSSYHFQAARSDAQGWGASNGGDAERTGLLVEIPSPTRGLRRSLGGRQGYTMGRTRGAGQIHPIDELEEETEENQMDETLSQPKRTEDLMKRTSKEMVMLGNVPMLDPFLDGQHLTEGRNAFNSMITTSQEQGNECAGPASGSRGVGAEHSAHSVIALPTGRLSPDKSISERTSSNLSERSSRSNLSWISSSESIIHETSIRPAGILNSVSSANPFKSPSASQSREQVKANNKTDRQLSTDLRTQSLTSIRSHGLDLDSFRTAHTSFAHLQAEGESLLGGNPERTRPGTSSSTTNTGSDTERSFSRAATATPATSHALDISNTSRPIPREQRRSWLGSVRRVLTRSTSSAERTRSLTTTLTYYEPYTDVPASPNGHSTAEGSKSFATTNAHPRRAASDASFWRNRRGKHDWLDDEQDSTWKRNAGDDWGAPEDIVMAARERQRQEWRDRGNLLVNITNDDQLPTPRTPIRPDQLGIPGSEDRPCTPASEADWDVEAAVERRVVQVMFTVPKSKLRVVNADVDGSSILSMPRDSPREDNDARGEASSPSGRVKDLTGRFEQLGGQRQSPRASPRPSPSPSIRSMKVRAKASSGSLQRYDGRRGSGSNPRIS